MRLAVTSDTMSIQDMTVLVEDQIEDVLAAVPGVADVQVYGDREKIFRIDVDQSKLASQGLTVADLRKALASVAFDSPSGSITTNNQDLIVRTTADVTTPEEFEAIVIGGNTHVRDVATVTLGPDIGQIVAALRRQDRHRPRHRAPGRIQHARHFRRREGGRRRDPEEPARGHDHQGHQRRRGVRRRRRARGGDRARPVGHRSC